MRISSESSHVPTEKIFHFIHNAFNKHPFRQDERWIPWKWSSETANGQLTVLKMSKWNGMDLFVIFSLPNNCGYCFLPNPFLCQRRLHLTGFQWKGGGKSRQGPERCIANTKAGPLRWKEDERPKRCGPRYRTTGDICTENGISWMIEAKSTQTLAGTPFPLGTDLYLYNILLTWVRSQGKTVAGK